MENKINIIAKDGHANVTALIGKDVQILEDHTSYTFHTDDLANFVNYCLDAFQNTCCDIDSYNVYYSILGAEMRCKQANRYTRSAAECHVQPSELVKIIERTLDKPLSLGDFDQFLTTFRMYIGDKVRTLHSYVKNFKATKITSIVRNLDNKGNFEYHVKREKGGAEDTTIPDTITVSIPVITSAGEDCFETFELDLFFDWKEEEGGCLAYFTLKAPMWKALRESAIRRVIERYIDKLPNPKYWGKTEINKYDDSWKYVYNGISG